MSRYKLIDMFGNESAETFNKCSKAYEQGRADAIEEFAELIKEHIDNNGTKSFTDGMQMAIFSKHYVDELAEQLKGAEQWIDCHNM